MRRRRRGERERERERERESKVKMTRNPGLTKRLREKMAKTANMIKNFKPELTSGGSVRALIDGGAGVIC